MASDTAFTPDMSVRQTILFHSLMREPGTLTRGRDTKGRVRSLYQCNMRAAEPLLPIHANTRSCCKFLVKQIQRPLNNWPFNFKSF